MPLFLTLQDWRTITCPGKRVPNGTLEWNRSFSRNDYSQHSMFITEKPTPLLFDVPFPAYSNVRSNVAGIMNYGYEISLDGYVFERNSDYQIEIQPLIVIFRGISAITGSLSTDPNEECSLSLRGNILMERRIFICSFVFPFLTFAV